VHRYSSGLLAIAIAACGPAAAPEPAAPGSTAGGEPAADRDTPADKPMSTDIPAPPWTIDYADGSANAYHLSHPGADADVLFEYSPVTPERSSTGMYSGGPPRQESLVADDPRLAELWRLLRRLESDPSLHTPERGKGTGALALTTAEGKREFIVQRGPALGELDQLLGRFGTR
jgi:hypothetical protein